MKIGGLHERELGLGRDSGPDGSGDPAYLDTDEAVANGDSLNLFDPRVFGVSEGELAMAFLAAEEDSDQPSDLDQKFSDATVHHFPDNRNGSRQKKTPKTINRVTAEDFATGTQRQAYLLVEKMKDDLFGHKSTTETRRAAIEFFFSDETTADDTFYLCCEVLEARCDVVRMRFQYEFWLRWKQFAEPFPFDACAVPELVQTEVMMCAGLEGLYLAREAWVRPGIGTDELLALATNGKRDEAVMKRHLLALYLMEERFLMSQETGMWYFTGRNPQLARMQFARTAGYEVVRGGSIYWSAMFPRF